MPRAGFASAFCPRAGWWRGLGVRCQCCDRRVPCSAVPGGVGPRLAHGERQGTEPWAGAARLEGPPRWPARPDALPPGVASLETGGGAVGAGQQGACCVLRRFPFLSCLLLLLR